MSSDPLITQLPISNDTQKSILQLMGMLGYSSDVFNELLRSILIEELLDRLRPSKNEIKALRMKSNHLEILKHKIESQTGVEWSIDVIQGYWQRIRLLDENFSREPIPFYRKIQVLATREHKCEFCGKRPPDVKLHVDHIYAASKGGSYDLWNLRLLCADCNLIKSNHLDWRLYAS